MKTGLIFSLGCLLGINPFSLAEQRVLLSGAIVHTVSGDVLSPGDVLIESGKIMAVGEIIQAGGNVRKVDLTGQHLYPGLIAATTSLGLTEINQVRATLDLSEAGAFTPDVLSWIAVNPDSDLIPVARANGITHALVVPSGGIVAGNSGLIRLHGWTTEQMAVRQPVALHLFWPSMELNIDLRRSGRSLDEQEAARRRRVEEIDQFFAQGEAYLKARNSQENRARPIPAWEAMMPFLQGEIPLMVYANDIHQIQAVLEWSKERNYRIILAGGLDAWRAADELAAREIPVIFEHAFTQPGRDTDPYDVHFTAPAVLNKAGVKVIFSEGIGGWSATRLRNLPYAAAQAVAFGLDRQEALKGLTLYPAQALGVDDLLGAIEAGKEATLIAVDGDILDVRANVTRMWVSGTEVNLESRHTRLFERYRNRPKPD